MPDDQRVVTIGGKTYRFPADATDAEVAEALERESAPQVETPVTPPPRGLLADFFLGAGKGIGQAVNSANASLASMGPQQQINPAILAAMKQSGVDPATLPAQAEARLAPENLTQQIGSYAPDVAAAFALPGVRSGQALRTVAGAAERSAVPGLTREGSEILLRSGRGRVSAANAAEATAGAQPFQLPSGVRVTPNAAACNAAESMQAAMARPAVPLWQDILAGSAGGYFGGKTGAGVITGLRLLNRPGVKSGVAQAGYTAAPVVQPAAAGLASGAARQLSEAERRAAILQRLLGGGGEPER